VNSIPAALTDFRLPQKLDRDKHSSLLWCNVSDEEKKFTHILISINSCKLCQINHFKHHSCCLSDDEGHSSPLSCELHRKNSGGSGYQSNDSYSSPQNSPVHSHHHNHHRSRLDPNANRMKSLSQDNLARMLSGSTGSGCSCSSSCSGSLASRNSHHVHGRPRLSIAKSSSHLLMDIDNNQPLTHQVSML
jgi:hypothetical protein